MIIYGQGVPSLPLSNPVYNPIVLNPAFVGSKDFTNISLTSKVLKSPDSQVLSLHKRMVGSRGTYLKFGIGTYLFQEQLENSWNSGIAMAGSYHYALDKESIHNIAAGATLKGIFNIPGKNDEVSPDTTSSSFSPNMDLGIYYYGPTAFAGLSVTSLLGTSLSDGMTVESEAYVPREYHFYGGYKFILSRKNSIVLEPSVLLSLNDSTLSEPQNFIIPYLKLYLQNFYIGSYFKSLDQLALFFQYQFPRFYTGVFLEFPRIGFLNDENIIFEMVLGINLGGSGHNFLKYRHW
jgi:type IX secretion system PorP/SprF family membrane protein